MTLPFSTHFPAGLPGIGGTATHFVEKIWTGLETSNFLTEENMHMHILQLEELYTKNMVRVDFFKLSTPKHHSIRTDAHRRWKAGMNIHMVLHNRTPQRFQFAPVLMVKTVQEIQFCHFAKDIYGNRGPEVYIDNIAVTGDTLTALAKNDGFDSITDFFAYFNTDFKGVLIHWTDLKY